MSLNFISRRILSLLRIYLSRRATIHTKSIRKSESLNSISKKISGNLFQNVRSNPALFQINLAHLYLFSGSLCNVSTYENLVYQKCSNGDKKNHDKIHPGRHKFHKDIEAALNEQVIIELNASFSYLAMATYFGRTEVALPGCQGFFMAMHEEEHEHALIFINYILMRGGHPEITNISIESKEEWKDLSKAFATAVEMESSVKEKLEELVELSEKHRDHQLIDFISGGFLQEQNESICSMARLLTRSKMAIGKVGEHLFDKHLFDSFVSKKNLMYLKDLPEEKQDHIYK